MISVYYNLVLASVYGSGTYDSANYNGTNAGTGGGLSNTGLAIAVIVAVAAAILLVAMVVRIWRRPSKKAQDPASVDTLADK